MLPTYPLPQLSDHDEYYYRAVVRPSHLLRKVLKVVPWDDFYEQLVPYYCPDMGRPSDPPVLLLKLEYLRYHYNLSDREVIERAETDLAFRFFLQVPLLWGLPDPSTLCIFRGRLGVDGFRRIFDQVVHTAREHGVVKDRLRIKDATHVIANVAVPSALALVAQVRDKLLEAARPFAPLMVEGERVNLELLREATAQQKPNERLVTRLAQLREMLIWVDGLTEPEDAQKNRAWQAFVAQRELAHKILDDQEHPKAGNRTVSVVDPDARSGKHGEWFDGYLVDVSMDADSELITQVNVLPASGDEAADAVELVRREEAAHGNDVQALSMDGVGFNGPLLRRLENPDGLNIDTYVPVPEADAERFTPQDFKVDSERGSVTCPAGQTSKWQYHDRHKETTKYRFEAATCRTCPLLARCMKGQPKRYGRTVCKTDYQAEHDRARQKTTTQQYAEVRHEHRKVERKLGEVMNRHGGRRAQYWGLSKVLIQETMASLATNIMRMVRLGCAQTAEISCQ